MLKVFNSLVSSQGLRSATLMTVGNVGATALAAIAMIIFSRLLGPADFGIFSVLFSLLLILSKIGDLGINTAVQREIAKHKNDDNYLKKIIQTGSYLKLIVIVFLVLTGLAAGGYIGENWLKVGQYSYLTAWVFIFSAGVTFYEYVNTALQGKELFTISVITNLTQALGKLVFALIFLVVGISMGSVIFLYMLMPLVTSLSGFFKLPVSYFLPHLDKLAAKKILLVAKWTSIAIISATIADNLDVILVQNYLSSYETGLWSAAAKLSALVGVIAWSLGIVLNVRVAGYQDKKHLRAYLKKAGLLALISAIGVSLLTLVSRPAIYYTVGPEFMGAVIPLNFLFLSTALLTAATPYIALFYLFDKPAYFALSGLIGTISLLLADVLLIPGLGLLGAGYARIITRLAVLIFTLYYARKAYLERYA